MATLQVVSAQGIAGKTTLASAIARGLAADQRVRLVRTGQGAAAEQDAATFADLTFVTSTGRPVDAGTLAGLGANEAVIVEADGGATPLSTAGAIIAVRGEPNEADAALGHQLGERLIGTIATNVSPKRIEDVARSLTNADLRPLAILPEDRRLAAPSVGEIRSALGAQVLYEGDNEFEIVEDFLVGPVYTDPARPHFRRFASKAILAPFNKTDLHLAAIETQAACLIITGDGEPSPYVVDRARGEATTVLIARTETPETIAALGDVWLTSRFRGLSKVEAAYALLQGRPDFAGLVKKLDS